ncbi:uncharacterized protein LOC130724434 [Lotus japonicus]|uniref:uncharacterized protein LOC130724434 n=1 Tax=Lotus japonicus TaxID=34305 RepID=UPI00258A9BD4|nr:uncharacterized protein LOC130724434 [Lotus japonicus]
MEGGYGGNRAEAERWLYTANKLLSARDLHGARSFAIRAQESDPRFEATELLLAVIDTLLAGEARIKDLVDCYAILQVVRYTDNIEFIAAQYRRLASLLDPHHNPFAFAAHAFSLVQDAWALLFNPTKKAFYDNQLRFITEPPQPHHAPPPPPPPPPSIHLHPVQNHVNPSSDDVPVVVADAVEEDNRPSQDNVTEPTQPSENDGRTFWTACPYCYAMFEYPSVYEECTLRCQSCRRGFHGVAVRSLPPGLTEEEGGLTSFCSWGFFPVGFSGDLKSIGGASSEWNPFSPLFPCALNGGGSSYRGRKRGPKVYYYDEAAVESEELSDSTEEEDSDDGDDGDDDGGWRSRLRKRGRRKGSSAARTGVKSNGKARKGNHNDSGAGDANANASVGNGEVSGGASALPPAVPNSVRPESSKRGALGGSRRRGAGNLGKLDLNVEFSNEVEEPAHGVREGNGTGHAEDNIEGIGFFEGLDEFILSSLPILNVVADDKVKGH